MKKLGLVALALALGGCPHKDAQKGGSKSGDGGGAAPVAEALKPIGTANPFGRLDDASAKQLQAGYKALRSKKYDDAAAAFRAVVAAAPDYTQADWALVRTLAIGGKFSDVPAAYETLIAKDFVAYAARLDTAKEFAGLRNAPEWARIAELRARYRAAYAKGLDHGFFFVARARAAVEPQIDPATHEAALDLKQEIFHYDVDAQRFRRVTETGGAAFALNRSPKGDTLNFLAAGRLHREGGVDSFVDPKVGYLDLKTLDTLGPVAHKGRFDQVELATSASGDPIFTFLVTAGAAETFMFDTARTGLAKVEGDGAIPVGGETRAWPGQVAHLSGKAVEGVKITDGANQFTIENGNQTVTAARPLAQSSLDWSPGRTRLTYAGKLDACQILKSTGVVKNELYVYDLPKKSAQRIAAAISAFETVWLDDDRLVYEGGVGKDGKLHLYAFTAHADTTLPTRNGAGLYGVPTLACEQAEPGGDTEAGTEEEEGD